MSYSNLQIFISEFIGTFVLVIFATGSIVYDTQTGGTLGIAFAAIAPFVALIIGIYFFGKISLASFNPAVTTALCITGHISKNKIVYYFAAELIGALCGSLFVMNFIGHAANLGANAPNHNFSIFLIFSVEVLASAMLMIVIFIVIYTKGLKGFGSVAIGGIVGLDIFFLSFISGASMNPARALAPALFSGMLDDLWLYWIAPYVGTSVIAFLFRNKFHH